MYLEDAEKPAKLALGTSFFLDFSKCSHSWVFSGFDASTGYDPKVWVSTGCHQQDLVVIKISIISYNNKNHNVHQC